MAMELWNSPILASNSTFYGVKKASNGYLVVWFGGSGIRGFHCEGDTMGYPKKSKSTKRNHQLTIG